MKNVYIEGSQQKRDSKVYITTVHTFSKSIKEIFLRSAESHKAANGRKPP